MTPNELPRAHGELVLVIDDEAAIRQVIRRTLEAFGYRVVTAEGGPEALSIYVQRQAEIGAVITDMMMPAMGGVATINRHAEYFSALERRPLQAGKLWLHPADLPPWNSPPPLRAW